MVRVRLVYYNTVHLNAVSSGSIFGSTTIFAASIAQLNSRNNIFVNNSGVGTTSGVAVVFQRDAPITASNYMYSSNNNLFYAGTPNGSHLIFDDGTNQYSTFTAFRNSLSSANGGQGQDLSSITENPPFLNIGVAPVSNFLHIDSNKPSAIKVGGNAFQLVNNYPDDYDGNIRSYPTSDIGADEVSGIVLPLDLVSFTGKASEHANHLTWSTANESNTSHFDVERMVNGVDFVKINVVAAAGDSKKVLDYSFTDNNLVNGVNTYYYRLKMVDQNGDFTYSKIVDVSGALKSTFDAFVSPNPSNGSVAVSILNPDKENASVDVFNLSGKKVANVQINSQDAFYTQTCDWSNLPKGVYVVKVSTASNVKTMKLIIE